MKKHVMFIVALVLSLMFVNSIEAQVGKTFINPFDIPDIIAGQDETKKTFISTTNQGDIISAEPIAKSKSVDSVTGNSILNVDYETAYLNAYDQSTVNLKPGGDIAHFHLYNQAKTFITGGVISFLELHNESSAEITEGVDISWLHVADDSVVNIYGKNFSYSGGILSGKWKNESDFSFWALAGSPGDDPPPSPSNTMPGNIVLHDVSALTITVTTEEPTNITSASAKCGGNITSDGGATVTARGICWNTSQNPTLTDFSTEDGTGIGNFTSSITRLTPDTTYYVRAYATDSDGKTLYGDEKLFKTSSVQSDSGLEHAISALKILTGDNVGYPDTDTDGSGRVELNDVILALRKAIGFEHEKEWTIIGELPEFAFSSEPIIDENTAFEMNVDPNNTLMLTAKTGNGWTVEYFAVKDTNGVPIYLSSIQAQHNDTDESFELIADSENRPVYMAQQDGKSVVINWDNYTIYGEKEWTIIDELPDFSSIQSPVMNDQTDFVENFDPVSPLWLTVTTSDGWVVRYFGTKDTDGYIIDLTFLHAENNTTGDLILAEIDYLAQIWRVSDQNGKIVEIDWKQYNISIKDGTLNPPNFDINLIGKTQRSGRSASACKRNYDAMNKTCAVLSKIRDPKISAFLSFFCYFNSAGEKITECYPSPLNPEQTCDAIASLSSVACAFTVLIPGAGFWANLACSVFVPLGVGHLCEHWYGNSSGDPHLHTFDKVAYDFQAVGEFVYLESTHDKNEMTVQIRQEPWGDSKYVTVNTAVAMSVSGDILEISLKDTPHLYINKAQVNMADKQVILLNNGCKIYAENSRCYFVIWQDNSMVEVRIGNTFLNVNVFLPENRKGLVKGLLGNCDGISENDLMLRDGSKTFGTDTDITKEKLYNEFGKSWRINQDESLFRYAEGESTETYTDLNFPYELIKAENLSEDVYKNAEQICRNAGITDPILLQDCILDVGLTNDSSFAENNELKAPEKSVTVTDDWLLYWDAQKAENDKIIRITTDERWKTGMALRESALNLDADFEKTFDIFMGDNNNGADGMIFLLLPETPPSDTAISGGGNLGFDAACNGKSCIGVEIDTYRNSSDPGEDHIALIKNGSVYHSGAENEELPLVSLSANIEDNMTHSLTIGWKKNTQTLSVTFDDTVVITHENFDLKNFLGTSVATYGFVGATGNATSEQYFYPIINFDEKMP